MNRFFRAAFAAALVYLTLGFAAALITGTAQPMLSFLCLYTGLLVAFLPDIISRQEKRSTLFMLFGAAIALFGFLFVLRLSWLHAAVHAIGIAAAVYFALTLRHNITYHSFKARFGFALIALALAFVMVNAFNSVFSENEIQDLKYLKLAVSSEIPVLIVLLITGVLLLRLLRGQKGEVDKKAFNRRQLRDTLMLIGASILLFVINPLRYIKLIRDNVLSPFLRRLGEWLLLLFRHRRVYKEEITVLPTQIVEHAPLPTAPPEVDWNMEAAPVYEKDTKPLVILFLVTVGIVSLVILIIAARKLLRKLKDKERGHGEGYPRVVTRKMPSEDEDQKKDRPSRFSRDPRKRMRYTYKEYLRHLRSLNVPIRAADTCTEINEASYERLSIKEKQVSTDELTDLYKLARYRMEHEPTKSDADRMRQLFNEIKGS